MGLFLILIVTFCCLGIYKSRSNSETSYRGQGDREMTCPECGAAYNNEHEIRYIENNSMCYHCFAIADDDLREMNKRSDRDDDRGDHDSSHNWNDRDDFDGDFDDDDWDD